MVAAVDSMAYTKSGGVPWHGLGTPVHDGMTPREMCKVAGLEWQVEARDFPQIQGIKPITDRKLLVRLPDDDPNGDAECLDIVGTDWRPVQNVQIFDYFTKFTRAGDMTMETAGSLKGGRFVWALAKTKQGFTLPGGDEINGYLLLMNPHQSGWALTAKWTGVRTVCWNTLSYALNGVSLGRTGTYRHRHDQPFDDIAISTMEQVIGMTTKLAADYEEKARFLASRRATEDQIIAYLGRLLLDQKTIDELDEKVMFPKRLEDIFDLPQEVVSGRSAFRRVMTQVYGRDPGCKLVSANGTWWGAVNTFTYATDHFLGNGGIEGRMWSANMGDNVAKKQHALDLALEYAKAA